jgi:glutamate-ammonia-ligase adenylyltransferase
MATGAAEEEALVALLPRLLSGLSGIAGPDAVLVNLERFAQSVRGRLDLYRDLAEHPRWLEILLTLFAGSQFLTEILLLQPDLFMRLVLPRKLAVRKPAARILLEARNALRHGGEEALDTLRRLQRLEFLRIGASDLLGLFDLETVTEELSNLADGLIAASLDVAVRETGADPAGFAVVAMGKLGGRELNYSSDIDLIFL